MHRIILTIVGQSVTPIVIKEIRTMYAPWRNLERDYVAYEEGEAECQECSRRFFPLTLIEDLCPRCNEDYGFEDESEMETKS